MMSNRLLKVVKKKVNYHRWRSGTPSFGYSIITDFEYGWGWLVETGRKYANTGCIANLLC